MKKAILFVVPSLRRGGAETQLISLANKLDKSLFVVHLACFDRDIDQLDKLEPHIVFHHIQRTSKYDLSAVRTLARLIDQNAIQVVHCTLQIALFYGWNARFLSKQKPHLVTTLHTTRNRDFKSELFDWLLYQWLMRSCQKVVFVCEAQRKHWARRWRFLKSRSVVIYNGIDVSVFQSTVTPNGVASFRDSNQIPPRATVIAHIAGFRIEKGHHLLLNAFREISSMHPTAHLVFAGDGVLRAEIEQLTISYGLSSRVTFLGNIADVRPLLSTSYISVISSKAETFSMAMLESMAMKVPLVAVDIGGTREAVIPSETGWLVRPNDISSLIQALNEALSQPALRDVKAENCRAKVVHSFTIGNMTNGYTDLFLNLT